MQLFLPGWLGFALDSSDSENENRAATTATTFLHSLNGIKVSFEKHLQVPDMFFPVRKSLHKYYTFTHTHTNIENDWYIYNTLYVCAQAQVPEDNPHYTEVLDWRWMI